MARRAFPQLVPSDSNSKLLPVPVTGGQQYRWPPFTAQKWMDKKILYDTKKNGDGASTRVEPNEEEKVYEGKDVETSMGVLLQGRI